MYQIGEFSYICQTTIKTLRHYDKINLLKPTKIDKFTGYRYYSEEQKATFKKIKELQQANFSLQEIKEILEKESSQMIEEKKEQLTKEFNEKINILEKMNMKSALEKNPIFKTVGLITIIKSRKDIEKVLKKVDKKLMLSLEKKEQYPIIFENFEKGYKERDILCFIGRVIPDKYYEMPSLTHQWLQKKLVILTDDKPETYLHQKVEKDILSTYQSMIEYASNNNIQIRGNFKEITNNDEISIYVEAYDLTKTNEDFINYNNNKLKNLKNINKKQFVGKWKLQGEITELPRNFNPKRKHYIPDTYLKEIVLYEDGKTNFENIIWKEDYLLITEDNYTICNRMRHRKTGLQEYIEVTINPKESNARPYLYYYKKIK